MDSSYSREEQCRSQASVLDPLSPSSKHTCRYEHVVSGDKEFTKVKNMNLVFGQK